VKPYPKCIKCGKNPDGHALVGSKLACTWDTTKKNRYRVVQEADFGPASALIVADLYRTVWPKRKLPVGLLDQVLALKKRGITSW
jgi:hypothetical protein